MNSPLNQVSNIPCALAKRSNAAQLLTDTIGTKVKNFIDILFQLPAVFVGAICVSIIIFVVEKYNRSVHRRRGAQVSVAFVNARWSHHVSSCSAYAKRSRENSNVQRRSSSNQFDVGSHAGSFLHLSLLDGRCKGVLAPAFGLPR